jgi:arylsulfatase A-like enzyme
VDESDALPAWPTLLSEALRDAGYTTWCVATNPNVDEAAGFDQGYDGFIARSDADAGWVNAQIQSALDRCGAERPMFLFAHIMEPHAPYAPSRESFARFDRRGDGRCPGWEEALSELEREAPEERARGLEHLIDRYDAEIFDADRAFGRFLDMLRRAGRFENALIVFLADHGESFRGHGGLYHGHTLAVQELHVPLIVRYPGGRHAGIRVVHRVGLTDIFPAAITEAGVRPNPRQSAPGRDLSPTASPDPVASRMYYQLSPLRPELPTLLGVLDEDGYKRVIAPCEPDRREPKRLGLWDTKVDPDEKRNVVDSMPVRSAYGEQLIAGWLAGRLRDRESAPQEAPRLVEATEERRRELRALGYLQ